MVTYILKGFLVTWFPNEFLLNIKSALSFFQHGLIYQNLVSLTISNVPIYKKKKKRMVMNFCSFNSMSNWNLKNKKLFRYGKCMNYTFIHIIYKKRVVAYRGVMGIICLNRTVSKRNFMTNVLVIVDDNGAFVKESLNTQGASERTILNVFHKVKD